MFLALTNPYYLQFSSGPKVLPVVDVSDSTGARKTNFGDQIEPIYKLSRSVWRNILFFAGRSRVYSRDSNKNEGESPSVGLRENSRNTLKEPSKYRIDTDALDLSRTNLSSAFPRLRTEIRSGGIRELLLISDGHFVDSSKSSLIEMAQSHNVSIHTISPHKNQRSDLWIAELGVPSRVPPGSRFEVSVRIRATSSFSGRIVINGEASSTEGIRRKIQMENGQKTYRFQLPGPERRTKRYQVRIITEEEQYWKRNSTASFEVSPAGTASLLWIGSEKGFEMMETIVQSFPHRNERSPFEVYKAEHRSPVLSKYDLVLIAGPAENVSVEWQRELRDAVRNGLTSVAMLGTSDSFLLGDWKDTPVETILPVNVAPPRNVTLQVVFDVSGSMDYAGGESEISLLNGLKRTVVRFLRYFKKEDRIGLTGFSRKARQVVPLQPLENIEKISEKILRLQPGGGTRVLPVLRRTYERLQKEEPSRNRYVFLITDGNFSENVSEAERMGQKYQEAGITPFVITTEQGKKSDLLRAFMEPQNEGAVFSATGVQSWQKTLRKLFIRARKPIVGKRAQVRSRRLQYVPEKQHTPDFVFDRHQVTLKEHATAGVIALPQSIGGPLVAGSSFGNGRSLAFTPLLSQLKKLPVKQKKRWFYTLFQALLWATNVSGKRGTWEVNTVSTSSRLVVRVKKRDVSNSSPVIRGKATIWKDGERLISRRGTYRGKQTVRFSFPDVNQGIYRFLGDLEVGDRNRAFQVSAPVLSPLNGEYMVHEPNHKILSEISNSTDGFHMHSLTEMVKSVKQAGGKKRTKKRFLRNIFLLFALGMMMLFLLLQIRRTRIQR